MSFNSNYPAMQSLSLLKRSINSIDPNESIETKIKRNQVETFMLRSEEAKRWIEDFHCIHLDNCEMIRTSSPFDEDVAMTQNDLIDLLKDGELILKLVAPFTKKEIKIHKNINLTSRMGFMKATDNINQFQEICKELGFPTTYLFSVPELWERKNISKVISCIHALAKYLEKKGYLKANGYPTLKSIAPNLSFEYNSYLFKKIEHDLMKIRDELNFNFDFDTLDLNDLYVDIFEDETVISDEDTMCPSQCRVDAISNFLKLEDELFLLVQLRNSKGEAITKSSLHNVVMDIYKNTQSYDLNSQILNTPIIENMSFKDGGRGCYECKVNLKEYSFVPGEYIVHARLDGNKLSPFRFAIDTGKPSALKTEILDGSELECDHFEGYVYQFSLLVKDDLGNIVKDEKRVKLDLKLGFGGGNKFINVKHATYIQSLNNGCYVLYFLTPLPGEYELNLFINDNMHVEFPKKFETIKLDTLSARFEEIIDKDNRVVIQGQTYISSFDQESSPFWLSILTENRISSEKLSSIELSLLNEVLGKVSNSWLENAQSNAFQYYLDKNYVDPEFDGESIIDYRLLNAGDTAWRIIERFTTDRENILFKYLKNSKFLSNFGISQVVLSDEKRDWSDYENLFNEQQEFTNLSHIEIDSGESDLLYSLLHPHMCSKSFWVWCSNKIHLAKEKGKLKYKDIERKISLYDIKEMTLKEYFDDQTFDSPRKSDIKHFSDLELKVAQRFIFEVMNGMQELLLVKSFSQISYKLDQLAKEAFEDFKKINTIATTVITKTSYLGNSDTTEEINSTIKSNAKTLITTIRNAYIHIMSNFCKNIRDKLLTEHYRISINSSNETILASRLVNMSASDLWSEWFEIFLREASILPRKIQVQHLQFPLPPNAFQKVKRTSAYSIQVPLNKYFDSTLNDLSNIPSKGSNLTGLINPWKIAFLKDSNVVFEGIRSGSLSSNTNNDSRRQEIGRQNTKELLVFAAMNQAKRFSREELTDLKNRGCVLQIPFTSLSLMTPFFVPDREDRITLEHAQFLLERFEKNEVIPIQVDLHDDLPPLKLSVRYSMPVLVNFGTNIAMKTFKRGIVFQRMINCRKYGMRNFEKKVNNYLEVSSRRRKIIREEFVSEIVNRLGSTREGQLYKQTIDGRTFNVERCYLIMEKKRLNNLKKIQILDIQISQLQSKLEILIQEYVVPNLNNATQIEIVCKWKVSSIVNDILKLHHEIYKLEKEFQDLKEMMTWDEQFVNELKVTLQQRGITSDLLNEYADLFKREKDIWEMYMEVRDLYHNYHHEDFAYSLYETNDVMKVDPYAVSVLIAIITFSLGEQFHFCCKTGLSRTGELHDQILEYCEWRYQFGFFPEQKKDKETFNKHRKAIHSIIALNGCTHEIARYNTGIPGSKVNKNVSGRFLPGLYDKYNGLSSFDKISKPSFMSREKLSKFKKLISTECGMDTSIPNLNSSI